MCFQRKWWVFVLSTKKIFKTFSEADVRLQQSKTRGVNLFECLYADYHLRTDLRNCEPIGSTSVSCFLLSQTRVLIHAAVFVSNMKRWDFWTNVWCRFFSSSVHILHGKKIKKISLCNDIELQTQHRWNNGYMKQQAEREDMVIHQGRQGWVTMCVSVYGACVERTTH